MNIEHKTAVALKWNAIAKLSAQLISWAVTLIVLRLLAPADYGLMAMVVVVISITSGIAEFGIGSSLVQAPTLDRGTVARMGGALAILNIGCCAAVALSAPWIAAWFGEAELVWLIRVAAVQFLFSAIEVVPQSMLQRELDFSRVARVEIVGALCASLSTLALAIVGTGVWALVLGWLLGSAVRAAMLVLMGRFVAPQWNLRGIGSYIRFGGTVTITRMIWQITTQLDTIIAGRYLTREAVGHYSVAMHFATLPLNKVMSVVNQVAFSAVSRIQLERDRLRARLLDALRLLGLVSVPALWGMSCVAPEIVDVVLGSKWQQAVIPLQLVSLVAPLRMLLAVLATALMGIGRADLELQNTIAGALVLIIAFAIGVRWGLPGLALSWLAAMPVVTAICIPRTLRAIGLSLAEVTSALRAPIVAGAAMYIAVSSLRAILPDIGPAWLLPLLVTVGGLAYLSAIAILDRKLFHDLRRVLSAVRS